MLDVRTLFVVIIASSLVLAAATVVAVRFRFRDGAGKWTGALLVQAVMYIILYLEHDTWPDAIALIVPNVLLALSLSLQVYRLTVSGNTKARGRAGDAWTKLKNAPSQTKRR